MKRIIALILVLTLSVFCFAACKKNKNNNNNDDTTTEKDYKLAIGVATTQDGKEVDNTVAALILDSDNKIVACRIDTLAVTASIKEGVVAAGTYKTKAELGDEYGMLTNSDHFGSKLAEWDDQAKAFETYVAGKTQAEVNGITLTKGKTDLIAGCTIAIDDFVKAVDNAFKSERKVAFKSSTALTLGVSANGTVANGEDNNGNAILTKISYTADYAATVIAGGKVIAAVIDSNEVTASIENDEVGAINNPGTKLEQGDNYGMVAYAGAVAEWYAQAQAYANTTVGKTVAEVAGLSTDAIAGSCTMYVGGYKVALEKAASYTR